MASLHEPSRILLPLASALEDLTQNQASVKMQGKQSQEQMGSDGLWVLNKVFARQIPAALGLLPEIEQQLRDLAATL